MFFSKIPQWPILAMGFRPFFFITALAGALGPAIWALYYAQLISVDNPFFNGVNWHSYEMIFGFSTALLAGFILTAGANWTGRPGFRGWYLAIPILFWLAERIVPFVNAPAFVTVALNLVFLPMLTVLVIFQLRGNWRNQRVFIPLFVIFSAAKILFILGIYLEKLNWYTIGKDLGLNLIRYSIVVVGGRIIPAFTRNRVLTSTAKVTPFTEYIAHFSFVPLFLMSLVEFPNSVQAIFWLFAFIAHFGRFLLYKSWQTLREPMLLILHVGYFTLSVSFLFEALKFYYPLMNLTQIPMHVFSMGALGFFAIGMMTRVALGHSGRVIKASALTIVMFLLIVISTVMRLILPYFDEERIVLWIMSSGLLWSLSFLLYVLSYGPILFHRRADGRAG